MPALGDGRTCGPEGCGFAFEEAAARPTRQVSALCTLCGGEHGRCERGDRGKTCTKLSLRSLKKTSENVPDEDHSGSVTARTPAGLLPLLTAALAATSAATGAPGRDSPGTWKSARTSGIGDVGPHGLPEGDQNLR